MRRKLFVEHVAQFAVGKFDRNYDRASLHEKLSILASVATVPDSVLSKKGETLQEEMSRRESLNSKMIFDFIRGYLNNKNDIYWIGEQVGRDLFCSKINIPIRFIKYVEDESLCIEFPQGLFSDGINSYSTCIVVFKTVQLFEGGIGKAILFTFPMYDKNYTRTENSTWITIHYDQDSEESVDSQIDSRSSMPWFKEAVDPKVFRVLPDMVKYVIKCLAYINCDNVVLENHKPQATPKSISNMRKSERDRCPLRYVMVGYDFHGRVYLVDTVSVREHMRFQRYGPGLSRLKYIKIDKYVRHYKKDLVSGD